MALCKEASVFHLLQDSALSAHLRNRAADWELLQCVIKHP